MRKEIRNLRQTLDSATRAHRKHILSIQHAVSKIALKEPCQAPTPASPTNALEQGIIQTGPIGYISSCFSAKNGTPRQPTICGPSRAQLRIQQSVFNNPEHSLLGLEQYSHVWIIFVFHKNGHLSVKAKVKPPRLNGQKVGVYSTRSPHRPNALGLTLAKLDKVVGDTLYLSDIDMIDGTPVLDIKPYIPEYDSPNTRVDSETCKSDTDQPKETTVTQNEECKHKDSDDDYRNPESKATDVIDMNSQVKRQKLEPDKDLDKDTSKATDQFFAAISLHNVLEEVEAYVTQRDLGQLSSEIKNKVHNLPKIKPSESSVDQPCYGKETYSTIAGWIREPPVSSLEVRFTAHAEKELAEFLPAHLAHLSGSYEDNRPRFKFLHSTEEATAAIRGVLSADPRSVYRRTRCTDKLFFFTLDTADVTCWFGEGFAEVLRVQPVQQLHKGSQK